MVDLSKTELEQRIKNLEEQVFDHVRTPGSFSYNEDALVTRGANGRLKSVGKAILSDEVFVPSTRPNKRTWDWSVSGTNSAFNEVDASSPNSPTLLAGTSDGDYAEAKFLLGNMSGRHRPTMNREQIFRGAATSTDNGGVAKSDRLAWVFSGYNESKGFGMKFVNSEWHLMSGGTVKPVGIGTSGTTSISFICRLVPGEKVEAKVWELGSVDGGVEHSVEITDPATVPDDDWYGYTLFNCRSEFNSTSYSAGETAELQVDDLQFWRDGPDEALL